MNTLLHISEGGGGILYEILEEIFMHGILDTLKVIPFLFLTYLLMEFIEHSASDKTRRFMERSGTMGPLVGGLLGALPQCGFSAAGANFYTARVISLGTLVAIFLSTSDEMLPIMISGNVSIPSILLILGYKILVGVLVGFTIDLVLRLINGKRESMNIDEMCEDENCNCKNGILRSALHHTLKVGIFVLLITLVLNAVIFFVGTDTLSTLLYNKPILSHIISSVLGLIPNCAVSIALTDLWIDGFITLGTMISGLCSGAGVGVAILIKINKRKKENLVIVLLLVLSGVLFGVIADLLGLGSLVG